MTKPKEQKSIKASFSLPVSFLERLRKLAKKEDISMSEVLRNAIKFYELQQAKEQFGRYGGVKIGQAKLTRIQREEQRAETIKMLQTETPAKVQEYLAGLEYLEPDRVENNVLYCYRIKDNHAHGRLLYQLQIDNKTGNEIYSRLVFTFDELVADLIKQKKI